MPTGRVPAVDGQVWRMGSAEAGSAATEAPSAYPRGKCFSESDFDGLRTELGHTRRIYAVIAGQWDDIERNSNAARNFMPALSAWDHEFVSIAYQSIFLVMYITLLRMIKSPMLPIINA